MKKLFFIAVVFFSFSAQAQFSKASLQASGLTCSMCSNAINKSLKSLDFVESVDANIKNSSFDVTFRPGSNVDLDKMKKKVEDAGFFVAKFSATLQFDNVAIKNDDHITIGANTFHFLNVKDQTLTGERSVRILDKGFVTAKEFKKNNSFTKMECYKTGVAGSCCEKDKLPVGKRIYHVTI